MTILNKIIRSARSAQTSSHRRLAEKSSVRTPRSRRLEQHASRKTTLFRSRSRMRARAEASRKLRRTQRDNNGSSGRRIVLLDACNVGYFHSNHRGFSALGVQLALQYFLDRGHEAYGMLPKFRLKPGKSSDSGLLVNLYRQARLILTPCKEFPSHRRGMSYDDRFMLEIAKQFDCAIVSNDRYRDLMHERPGWAELVETRRIPFEWHGNSFTIPESSRSILNS